MVFQLQLALLQTAQLQLVVMAIQDQQIYDRIEIAMFHVELDQAPLDFSNIRQFLLFPTVFYNYF
jgi:hypothetical protein